MGKPSTADKRPNPAAATGIPNALDERDATIARLERAVAEERQNATTLREANDALKFKLEILEKSYAKQLGDARKKMEHAVQELAGHQARLAELGPGGEETLRLFAETKAELNRVKADYVLIKEQLARGGARASSRVHSAEVVSDTSSTINALIMAPAAQPPPEHPAAGSSPQPKAPVEEAPLGDMLSPELMFAKRDKDDDR